ncbi:helix-turn-helix domain-containing protein, partial [Pseudomonas aeruginosa]|nr:helix-turn-helix domain-containing protein [Pseudomonas aeruginosa]
LKDLETICRYLNCQVSDLLEIQEDPEG